MENQVEVLETSNVSLDEIDEWLRSFELEDIPTEGHTDESPEPTDPAVLEEAEETLRSITAPIPPTILLTEESSEDDSVNNESVPIIQPNSPTLLIEESSSRFSSALWYDAVKSKSIVLAGVGGIGSYVAFLLSRMKPSLLTIYDPDIVEEVNMSGQLYSKNDVGKAKVDSIANMIADYSNFFGTMSVRGEVTDISPADHIMICGFDNMKARRLFFNSWLFHVSSLPEEEKKKCLFIDGRLAAEEFQVFCITGDDRYHQDIYMKEYLFSDAEADETICSYKQTSHCANMIGSIIVNLFVNFVANECEPLIPRDLPFITTYDAERMFFKTSI